MPWYKFFLLEFDLWIVLRRDDYMVLQVLYGILECIELEVNYSKREKAEGVTIREW